MSRTSKREGSSSPVKKYLSFKGGSGSITFYDKDTEERKELDSVSLVLVDDLASVSGFNEAESSGYSSNLLNPYDTGKIKFEVKTKINGTFGTVATGVWKDIKGDPSIKGAKYTRNLFAIADVGSGYELVRLELNGSGLSPWTTLVDEEGSSVYDKVITVSKGQLYTRKAGKNSEFSDKEYTALVAKLKKNPMADKPVLFYAPKIELTDVVSDDLVQLAEAADSSLQDYLNIEVEDAPEDVTKTSPSTRPEPAESSEEADDLPF